MKKTVLTLLISVLILGITSTLFSLREEPVANPNQAEANQNRASHLAPLPSSRDSFLTASLNPNFIPIRDWSAPDPEIQAKAAGVFDPNGEKFLYRKNIKDSLPIASLSKIMTAIIVLENLELDDVITVSKKSIMAEGKNGNLAVGEKLTVRDLLHIMLIESSNDAAVALAEHVDNFTNLANKKANELNLEQTNFVEPSGISQENYSTVYDLVQLANYSYNYPLIWQILKIKEVDVYSQDKHIVHHLINTNKLLDESSNWTIQFIGGKTGFTEEAGQCMLTMIEKPDQPEEYLITVVLGTNDRELETKKLIQWIKKAYVW